MRDLSGVTKAKKVLYWTSGIVIFVIALIAGWGIAGAKDSGWWAAWGQWVGGIGAIIAAGVAVWIAVEGWQRTERQQAELHAREQASKFAVWIDNTTVMRPHYPPNYERKLNDPAPKPTAEFCLMFQNSSALPIYDVSVHIRILDRSYTWTYAVCTPDPSPQRLDDERPFIHDKLAEQLKRVESAHVSVASHLVAWLRSTVGAVTSAEDPLVVLARSTILLVEFRDANGLRWRRQADGKLKAISV